MYSLLKGFYEYCTLKEEYCVMIIGLDNAGKTTLLERFKMILSSGKTRPLPPERITPTIGLNLAKFPYRGKIVKFWDLGGQTELRSIWQKYYSSCHGVMFVMDSTDGDRMIEAQEALTEALKHEDLYGGDVPILLLANKRDDIERALPLEQIKLLFHPIATSLDASDATVLPICAIDGTGIQEGLDWIFDRMIASKRIPIFDRM
jgi:ADP-ribosylation factor related protein 1